MVSLQAVIVTYEHSGHSVCIQQDVVRKVTVLCWVHLNAHRGTRVCEGLVPRLANIFLSTTFRASLQYDKVSGQAQDVAPLYLLLEHVLYSYRRSVNFRVKNNLREKFSCY